LGKPILQGRGKVDLLQRVGLIDRLGHSKVRGSCGI
jgi:hypothetical protein